MHTPVTGIILAAGMGSRLAPAAGGLPKPLVPVGGRSILARSLETLRRAGIQDLTVVVGHQGQRVAEAAGAAWPGVRIVENADPAGTGSMRSLALAWRAWGSTPPPGILVVEGDVIYGVEAVTLLQSTHWLDTVLASNATGAGDEVWILGDGQRILEIAKRPTSGRKVLGELVGLSLLSPPTLETMVTTHLEGGLDSALEHYEERLSAVSATADIHVHVAPGLAWGEVDDNEQLARVEREVLPRLEATGQSPERTPAAEG